jgi:hypothetical protein
MKKTCYFFPKGKKMNTNEKKEKKLHLLLVMKIKHQMCSMCFSLKTYTKQEQGGKGPNTTINKNNNCT